MNPRISVTPVGASPANGWEEVFDRQSGFLREIAFELAEDRSKADEAMMDSFVELQKTPRVLEGSPAQVRAWLLRRIELHCRQVVPPITGRLRLNLGQVLLKALKSARPRRLLAIAMM